MLTPPAPVMIATMNAMLRLQRLAARAALGLPAPVLGLAGKPPVVDGQRLDPQLTAGLAWANRFGPRLETMSVPHARRAASATFDVFNADPVTMASVRDDHAPGPGGRVPVRVFIPREHHGGLVVYFHGGGGVIGSVANSDSFVRDLAARAGCVIASVDYRLAPEHPHPAAIDDAVAAYRWAVTQAAGWGADPARVAVGGDSFGGFLAAWVERRGRAEGLPRPRLCALIYPLLDLTCSSPSYRLFAEGFGLTLPLVHWFRRHYAPDRSTWRTASPMFLDDVTDVAPTFLLAAGFDCLRDEGRAWEARVQAAGGQLRYRCHDGLIHGFIELTNVSRAARAAVDELADELRLALAG